MGIPGCYIPWHAYNIVSSVIDLMFMVLPQCLLIFWCGCPTLSQILAPQEKPTVLLSWILLWFSHSRCMFEAQMLTGLWWVLWQTLQAYFPQRVPVSGTPASSGSPSRCTQSLFLKIGSVFWKKQQEILLGLEAGRQASQSLWIWESEHCLVVQTSFFPK